MGRLIDKFAGFKLYKRDSLNFDLFFIFHFPQITTLTNPRQQFKSQQNMIKPKMKAYKTTIDCHMTLN